MAPQKEAGEDIGVRRRRARYRAWHRGMRELDLLLGPYADAKVEAMPPEDLTQFEALLRDEDTALQGWLMGRETPPPGRRDLIAELVAFQGTLRP